MYLLSHTLYPNEQQQGNGSETFIDQLNRYFGSLIKNGQVLMNDCNTIHLKDKFITYFLAPEPDSLDMRNSNIYVENFYKGTLSLCNHEPTIQLLGKSTDYDFACTCESPGWYMLYSDYTANESPIVCGNCGKSVPLYKLPKILGEDEYYSVLRWQKAYNACDRLFMEGIAERTAYARLSKPASDLSKLGRQICIAFENTVGKPFYYYLYRYYSPHKPICPECSGLWKLDEGNNLFIDYQCKKCKLVADLVKNN